MRILITGSEGYIGSHLLQRLVDNGHSVVGLDKENRGKQNGCEFWWLDLYEDSDNLRRFLTTTKFDVVVHLAAMTNVGDCENDPIQAGKDNSGATVMLLSALNELEYKPKLIFSSSAAVYKESGFKVNEDSELEPKGVYGLEKWYSEKDIQRNYEGPAWILRFFNVYGGDMPDYNTSLINVLDKLDRPVIFGDDYPTPDGTCVRDFIHIEDLLDLLELCIKDTKHYGGILNVGTGIGTSVLELMEASGKRFKIGERRQGDIIYSVSDCNKARGLLGWEAKKV